MGKSHPDDWGKERALQLGIDIGGTFTDLTLRAESGALITFKTPTRSDDPAAGIADALKRLDAYGVRPHQISYFVHGTTVALNSIIQRSGANTALVVTEGFRDVLELARLRIPIPFSFYSRRPEPLVPRERVLTVRERVRHDGTIETPLDDHEVDRVLEAVRTLGVESVAICLLHSYVQPAHELRLKEALAKSDLDLFISCSCEIWPEIREYERALVTVMNAYVGPPAAHYLEQLDNILRARNVEARPYLTRSNGGIMTSKAARREAVHILLSGPASGVIGAAKVASEAGLENFITFDMGGTSADIAVIENGRVAFSTDEHVGDFPVIIPTVAISSIGAGGGSIAAVDAAGILRVGPESAGAEPGPACYGLGGHEATVTDAFLSCGFLNPRGFAGKDELDEAAADLVMKELGAKLGFQVQETAEGILQVALANMYGDLTAVLERRGIDPRDFVLVAFGGAGPLMACFLADEISVSKVLFPPSPGTLCAFGALSANVTSDFVRSVNWRPSEISDTRLSLALQELIERAQGWLEEEAPSVAESEVRLSADLRYVGQSYEIEVTISAGPTNATVDLWPQLLAAFHKAHEKLFGQSDPEAVVELINLRARAVGFLARHQSRQRQAEEREDSGGPREIGQRPIRLRGSDVRATLYDRSELRPGDRLHGPVIVQQPDTTVFVPPRWSAVVDEFGNIFAGRDIVPR